MPYSFLFHTCHSPSLLLEGKLFPGRKLLSTSQPQARVVALSPGESTVNKAVLTELVLGARPFACVSSFNPHDDSARQILLLSPVF